FCFSELNESTRRRLHKKKKTNTISTYICDETKKVKSVKIKINVRKIETGFVKCLFNSRKKEKKANKLNPQITNLGMRKMSIKENNQKTISTALGNDEYGKSL
ncbi:MAG: hypothetical protein U9O87_10025, partial [Verrucomicrobiota bacterium]|nr:hypothetical protein [Verrucomicrobiota bacterium]